MRHKGFGLGGRESRGESTLERVMSHPRRSLRSPSRRFSLTATAAVILLGPALVPGRAGADGVDEKRRQIEALADQLDNFEMQMQSLDENYIETLAQKDQLSEEITAAEADVAAAEASLAQMRGTLYTSAVNQFMHGGRNSTLTNLFASSGGVQDALQREQLISIALNQGSLTTDSLDATATELSKKKTALEKKRKQAEAVAEDLLSRQGAAEEMIAKYEQLKNSAQGDLAQLLVQVRQQREAQLLADSERQANSYKSQYSKVRNQYRNLPKVSARSQIAIQAALRQLGTPYRYAMSKPGVAFDCSGLTTYAWGKAGVALPRNSRAQYGALPKIPKQLAQPGDLIFTGYPIHHVGIYLGGGRMVHAPQTGDVVKIGPIRWWKVVGVARPG